MLKISKLYKSYGDKSVFEGIDLEFDTGINVLLAPNGAGKTTLMKMVTGLLMPTSGSITYDGKDIYNNTEFRDCLGYLPQKVGYYKNYTAMQYLRYLSLLKNIELDEIHDLSISLLKKFGLEEVKDKKLKTYSGGMLQRVGIAGALINDPSILILDEPTAGLDPKERVRFKNILSDLAKEKTIIVSTHITSDIEFIANQIIMIKDEVIIHKGTVTEVCSYINDKIFETNISPEEIKEFEETHFVLVEKYEGDSVRVRFFHRQDKQQDWKMPEPTLEDLFMYEYQDNNVLLGGDSGWN